MDTHAQPTQPGATTSQTSPTVVDREQLEQQLASGANWFYWIAGLSLANSLVMLFGGGWGFIVGLGVTQAIDAIVLAVAEEAAASGVMVAKGIALGADLLVAGLFVFFGWFAGRKQNWAFVVGMVLYALDGLLFLLVADWLSLGFHGFALYCIASGLSANRKLSALPDVQPMPEQVSPDPITP